MEEILASIRRIIESNEPGAVPGEPAARPGAALDFSADDEISTDFPEEQHPVIADSMGMPLRAANSAVPPRAEREAPAAPQEKPQSLADIAARVRNASERVAPPAPMREEAPVMHRPAPLAQDFSPAPLAQDFPLPQPVAMERPPELVAPPQVAQQRPQAGEPAAAPQSQPQHYAPAGSTPLRGAAGLPGFDAAAVSAAGEMIARYETEYTPAPRGLQPEAPAPVAPSLPVFSPVVEASQSLAAFDAPAEPEDAPLLSSETGAMVARSFGELAEAVDGAQRRSLDEIAGELLRPMLREWLDDNLPTLVERLVREEIERVARGPRR